MTPRVDWNALAHRAIVTAAIYGLGPRTATPKVRCAMPGAPLDGRDAEMVVTVDAPELDAAWFAAARGACAPGAVFAVVVASKAALGLVSSAVETDARDAYARAAEWAAFAAKAPRAPAVSPERLREIASAASSAELVLVEPEVPHVRHPPKHAIDRAILATIALGATARPLVFVREGSAPKAGLARVRDERLLDGWLEGRGMRAHPNPLVAAALETLAETAAPMRGKDLLREARARSAEAARAAGARAPTSSSDAAVLAKALRLLWLDGALEIYAGDPATPLVAS